MMTVFLDFMLSVGLISIGIGVLVFAHFFTIASKDKRAMREFLSGTDKRNKEILWYRMLSIKKRNDDNANKH